MQRNTPLTIFFSLAVLLGAFLLFTLEPLVGKLVTPGFGGTASIWSTCLLFFQVGLLGGYLLAYSLANLSVRVQSIVYVILLVVSAFFANLPARDAWICSDFSNPSFSLMVLLTIKIALPFVVLSSTSVVMQNWYRYAGLGNPYPLYSVSNIGSVAALVCFPILLEPNLTTSVTSHLWSYCYIGLIVLSSILSVINLKKGNKDIVEKEAEDSTENAEEKSGETKSPSLRDFLWWCLLSAGGSVVLLSFTTYITEDVSPIPLFWILPLGVYLSTFILLFSYPSTYFKRTYAYLWTIFWLSEMFVKASDQFWPLVFVNLALVFLTCMVFHGEMVASRPHPKFLPHFYLSMSFGGALGGVFVNFIAPFLFNTYLERLLSIILLGVITIYLVVRGKYNLFPNDTYEEKAIRRYSSALNNVMISILSVLSIALAALLLYANVENKNVIAEERNFYSSIKIIKEEVEGKSSVTMVHGRVVHGRETSTGIGTYWEPVRLAYSLARSEVGEDTPLKVGIIGLGVGANVAWSKEGDSITFYELDPKVEKMATDHFSYLKKCKAKVSHRVGDGRLVLDREKPNNYDLLLIDVFNGNAIPVHLLTKESMEVYLKHLKPNGIMGFHVSNRYLDLVPVVGRLAKEANLYSRTIRTKTTIYVLLTRNKEYFERLPKIIEDNRDIFKTLRNEETPVNMDQRVWTDDYVNLLPYIRKEGSE